MKKLIAKELREQFKVALIGLGVFTVILGLAFAACDNLRERVVGGAGGDESLQPLLSSYLLTQAAIFCGLFAALLGWLQMRAEKHPDLWAFLMHRPVERIVILQSKVFSGLFLYALGAGLPMFGLMVLAAVPGNVAAPFQWAMALPLCAIFLVGVAYYLAGMLTGLRKARWYTSLVVGLGLPVLATLWLFMVSEFWQALGLILAVQGILGLAVWGSFSTNGHYRGQPAVAKCALVLAATAATLVLLGFVAILSLFVFARSSSGTYSYYQILKDGRVARITHHPHSEMDIVDLSGNPLVNTTNGQRITQNNLGRYYANSLSAIAEKGESAGTLIRLPYSESYSRQSRFFSPVEAVDKTLWYLTADGRLLGYNGVTRQLASVLVPSRAPGRPDDSRFLAPRNSSYSWFRRYEMPAALASAKRVYLADLQRRELRPLLTVSNDDSIVGYSPFYSGTSNLVLVLTSQSIRVLDYEGRTKANVPYQPPPSTHALVNVGFLEASNAYAIRLDPIFSTRKAPETNLLSHIKWVGADGSVMDAMDLPKLPDRQDAAFYEKCFVTLTPPAIYPYRWADGFALPNALRFFLGLLCAGAGWWLGSRNTFSLRDKIIWGLFHFAFALPGFLAFLALQEWPTRERCSNCAKIRSVNREHCEHCGATFAPPEPKGTEIFEPLEKA